jgi:lysophospholipase L1-like esterase
MSTSSCNGRAAEPAFTYINLNERPPSRFTAVARRYHPGTREVAAQLEPYAARWRSSNLEALTGTEPLWVVLGDSLSQGIGASAFERGWVPLCSGMLREAGVAHRVVNLSFSGARIGDVIARQLPALAGLGSEAELCTVMIGSNDVIRPNLRLRLRESFRELLDVVPDGSLIATMPQAAGGLGSVGALVAAALPRRGLVEVPVSLGEHRRSVDRWHPGDGGYAALAERFFAAIRRHGSPIMRAA